MTTTTKPRGNLSKAVVLELVKDATPEQINALFTSPKTNKPTSLASRARTVELLALTGAKKKAVEEYAYPTKRKPRKTVKLEQLQPLSVISWSVILVNLTSGQRGYPQNA